MKIETKYSDLERLWYIHENSVKSDFCKTVEISASHYFGNVYTHVYYKFSEDILIPENKVFKTKSELLASL